MTMINSVQGNPALATNILIDLVQLHDGDVRNAQENISELSADARFCPYTAKASPLLMILHGFKAFARWVFFPYFGEYFVKQIFLTITVNFSLNGVPHRINPNCADYTEPEQFARNTISQSAIMLSVRGFL